MWHCDKLIQCFENIEAVNAIFNLIIIVVKLNNFIDC